MLSKGMKVQVYDGDLVGWTTGSLKEQYLVSKLEKWIIDTKEGSTLVRYIKNEYEEMNKDGCGYLI